MQWKVLLLLIYAIVFMTSSTGAVAQSLFIDESVFLSSAHGMLKCMRCHTDKQAGAHPSVEGFNAYRKPAFSAEKTCLASCHKDIARKFEEGVHAGIKSFLQERVNCIACHNPHSLAQGKRRKLASGNEQCFSCHGVLTGKSDGKAGPLLCLACHSQNAPIKAPSMSGAITPTHKDMNCLTCHKDALNFPHFTQRKVDCLTCHVRHEESVIGDAHSKVDCVACHGAGIKVVKNEQKLSFAVEKEPLEVHELSGKACTRCHQPAIAASLGAPATVLPAKGVLCAGCHVATLGLPELPSKIGAGIFILGFACIAFFLFFPGLLGKGEPSDGLVAHEHEKSSWKTLAVDIFLQCRLQRESLSRWLVHLLIFLPFLVRFVWGMLGLLGSKLLPSCQLPWLLLDKDWIWTAFVFDFTGLSLLLGLVLAVRLWRSERKKAENAPRRDWLALYLLLALTLTGFVLEAMRIGLGGFVVGMSAFIGTPLAYLFTIVGSDWIANWYGVMWYVHAVLTALTVAYIPFSQLRHIFLTPLFMIVQNIKKHR